MHINSYSSMRTDMRISGLASGLDTDSIINDLMKIEQMRVDRLKQDRQIVEWRKEDYREITNLLRGFKDEYFDIAKPENNMLSPNTYKVFSVTSSSDFVAAVANADASAGTYIINEVAQLASAAYVESTDLVAGDGVVVSKPLKGSIDFLSLGSDIAVAGKSFYLTVDNETSEIKFSNDYLSSDYSDEPSKLEAFRSDLQAKLDDAFGSSRVMVDVSEGKIMLVSSTSTVTVTPGIHDALESLGFETLQSNRLRTGDSLQKIFGETGSVRFKINGVSFEFHKDDSLREVMSAINNSNAGVSLTYSSLTDRLTLKSKRTGAGEQIIIDNLQGNFFGDSSYTGISADNIKPGENAVFYLNDPSKTQPIQRSTNTFTIDGVTFTLKGETTEPASVTVARDVDASFDKIKAFVDKYNELIGKIHEELGEKRYSDYLPLTDEQRKDMSEKEIELWEDKARSGLLKNDPILESIVHKMRSALMEKVDGVGIHLAAIGITTGSYYEKGKLHIDEIKLKEALQNNEDQVMQLFSQQSEIDYSPDLDGSQSVARYRKSGLMQRLSDILQNNIRSFRDSNGHKGILLEKAGITGDITEFNNFMDDEIKRLDKRIEDAQEAAVRKEERYWRQFTELERAIQRMNVQSMWLAQQLGMGGQ